MNWLWKRLREPTTWLGLGAAQLGIGQALKIDEAPAIADALTGVGQAVAGGVDPISAGILGIAGIVAALMKEKGNR